MNGNFGRNCLKQLEYSFRQLLELWLVSIWAQIWNDRQNRFQLVHWAQSCPAMSYICCSLLDWHLLAHG